MVDEHGVPLSLVVSGANRHDGVSLEPLLTARILWPKDDKEATPNLCLDAGWAGKGDVAEKIGFTPHLRPRGEEKKLIERDPDVQGPQMGG